LYALSMHGAISCLSVPKHHADGIGGQTNWTIDSKRLLKAVTLKSLQHRILTCGIGAGPKGVVECWRLPE
jgi:hypothetical protein